MKRTRSWAYVLIAALVCSLMLGNVGPLGAAPAYAAEPSNANLDFESGSLDGWTTSGAAAAQTTDKHGGSYSAKLTAAGSTMTRTIAGIEQGSYTLSAWVKGATSGNSAYITATETGGPDARSLVDVYISPTEWRQISIRNVLVYNGQVKLTIASGNGNNLAVDDIQLTLDSSDENPLSNWNFEAGDLSGWTVDKGTVAAGTSADTGTTAAVLSADAQLSQTVSVKPNTTYIATVRAKVDRQDAWETIYQKNYLGNTGQLVNVTSYGDRVNLGVKTADGTVLRQAPSGTAGYSLLTLRFKTGPNDAQVTLYANTIKNADYVKSVTTYTSDGANGSRDQWQGNGTDKAYVDNFDLFAIDNTTVKGADVSFLPIIEDNGGKYFANGVQQDCLTILANHGVNAILGMLFVRAGNPVYDQSPVKQMQYTDYTDEDGNPFPYTMQAGYFDKTHALALAQRAKALDIGYMPSFHFSDAWMSAGKAFTPYDWMYKDASGKLVDQSLDEMTTTMYNYVYDFIKGLVEQGTVPMGAKIGNEQDGGIAWPNGKGYSSAGYKALINSAYDAVHDAAPGVSAFIHTNNGYTPSNSNTQFGTFRTNGVKFDGQAYSLYGGHTSDAIPWMLTNNIEKFPDKDYLDVETGYAFTKYNPDWADESGSMGQSSYYAIANPNGQYNWLLDYMQAMREVANPYDRMRGFFYWETDWIVVEGAGASTRGPNTVDRRTMFNNGDPSIKEMGSLANGKMGDMMDSMYAYLWRGHAKNKPATMLSPLQGFGTYAVTKTAPTGISLNKTSLTLAAGNTERLLPAIAPDSNASAEKLVFDSTLAWTSSDPSVATVNEAGYVTAKSAGTAVITAKTIVGGLTATSAVTVEAASKVGAGNLTLTVGGAAPGSEISAKVWDKLVLKGLLPAGATDQHIVFKSSDPSVASFLGEFWQSSAPGTFYQQSNVTQNVKLNVKRDGTTIVSAAAADGTAIASFTLNATKVPVSAVTLDKTSATVSLGRTQQLKATVAPANASFAEVTWSSSDTSVATVDANGLVTTLSTGTTTIAAASVDNPSIKGTAVINVVPVMVTGLMLDKSTLNLMIGTTKPITAAVMPADAYNKKIVWSSSDESIATVDASGRVTGHLAGTAVVTAVTDDGGFTKTLTVNVQSTPVAVTGIATDKAAFYFASDAFSTTNPSAVLPSVQLKAAIAPEDATNLDVEWKSNNPSIATVDAFGVVTARKPGVAFITATSKDGGFEARTAVYVPSISESFDNRALADNWSVSAGSAAAIPAAVATPPGYAGQLLQFSAGGSGARAAYKSLNIANNKIVLDFDWNVGSPAAGTGQLRIQDGAHNNYLTLGVPTGASSTLQYSTSATLAANTPLSGSAVAASGFNTASTMYNVRITLDMTAKKTSFTLTNKSTAQTTTVADLPFAPGTSFDGKLGYLELYATRNAGGSMNWNTQFDNFNVYAAAPTASSVSLNRPTVSLLDIPGTPGNTFQLKATVNPNVEGVDQAVTWSTSDEAIATVSQSGLVTAVSDGIATVTATVVSNPSLSATAGVSVHPIIPVEAIGIQDDHGTAIDETTVNVKTGDAKQLKAVLNPSVADVRSLTWSSSDPAVASIDHDTGLLTALAAGDTVVTLTVDAYPDFGGYTGSTSFNLHVTGPAVLIVTGLQSAIADAIAAKTLPDNGYTADSLSRYKTALEAAQTALTQAQTELWDASHQPEIDGLAADLQAAAAALALDQSAPVEAVTVSPGALTLTVGLSGQLVAEVLPVYAGDKRLAWSSDNETIAVVDASGRVTALAPGTAHIEAKALNGGVVGTTTVTVASDLSSGYAANGGAVSASKSKSGYTPSNPIANASTMNPAGAAWTTGGNLQTTTTPEFWQIDLGSTARIDNVKMNFWQTMKYSLLVSDDSVNWTTAYDNSQSYGGDTAAIFDVQLPAATYGRYIRLNIYGVSTTKDWVGVTVFQANGAFVPAPESVTANKSQASLEIGATLQLNAQVTPAYGDPRLTWSSSDDAVATVDATGHVTAIGAGSAVIEATTVNGKKAEVALTVVTEIVPVTGVNVDQEPFSLIAGTAGQVTATIMPAEATNKTVVWTSSDTSVATVGADGKVTAKAPGTATITATTEDGGFTATTTVTVTKSTDPEPVDTKVTGVSVDKASLDLIVGATGQLIATVAPADATNKTVVWTSSDTSVATVGADGKVTAKAPGTATITATTEDGGFKAAATVTVTAPAGGVNPDPVVTSPPASDNGTPATNVDADGRVKIAAKPDATGNVKASLTAASLAQAIAKATSGKLQIQVDAPQASGKIEVELPVGELLKTDGTIKSLSIRSGDVDMTLAIDASVLGADAKTLNVSMVPAQRGELSEQARQLVGDRPVYDLDLRVDGEKVSSFGSKGAVVVSIDYTLKAGEDVSGLVIFFIGEDGKMEPVKRSGYDEANGRITFRPAHFSRYAVAYVPVALKDLNEAPWAKSMIQSLAARQILRGTSTDSFEPGRSVTRAEFLQMLVSSLGLDKTDLTGASAFSDVPAGVWYEKAVASGVQLGIVKGRADGTFGAHEAVTREDMAVMLSRALQAAGLGLGDEAESGADFNDRSEIAAYATAAVDDIRRAGLINGFQDGSFGPKLPTTRAQAAAVIYKLLGF